MIAMASIEKIEAELGNFHECERLADRQTKAPPVDESLSDLEPSV